MSESKGTSPWVWVGCGCVGCAVLLVVVIAGAGYFGFRSVSGFRDAMLDPEIRSQRVREILGAEELPEGYRARLFMRIPFLGELAVIGDGRGPDLPDPESGPEGPPIFVDGYGDRFFVFLHLRRLDRLEDEDQWSVILGQRSQSDVNIQLGYTFQVDELLEEGEIPIDGGVVEFRSTRGELISARRQWQGAAVQFVFRCDDASSKRVAGWFVRDDLVPVALSGEDAASFLAPFSLCP